MVALVATFCGRQMPPAIAAEAARTVGEAEPAVASAKHAAARAALKLNIAPMRPIGDSLPVVALAMAAQSDRLVSGSDGEGGPHAFGQGMVRLWDVKLSEEIVSYSTERGVTAVAISADGRLVAWSTWANDVVLRTVAGDELLRENVERPTQLAFSPDGKLLVAATEGQKVLAWNVETGQRTDGFPGEMIAFYWVDFSPDGKLLAATGGTTGQPFQGKVWDVATRRQLYRVPGSPGQASRGAISRDGLTLATCGSASVALWDLATGIRRSVFNVPGQELPNGGGVLQPGQGLPPNVGVRGLKTMPNGALAGRCVALAPVGSLGASGDTPDGSVLVWDAKLGQTVGRLRGHSGAVRALAFAHDGKTLITGSIDCSIRLWDLESREQIGFLQEPREAADLSLSAAYSPDGASVASGLSDGRIRITRFSPPVASHCWQAHGDAVAALAWSPDGRLLASSGYENDVKLWNPANGELVRTLRGHQGWNVALAFSPDGQTLASGGYDRTIILWNVADGQQRCKLSGGTAPIRSLAFAHDGSLLASGSADGAVRLWDVAAGQQRATLTDHKGVVRALAFSADDRMLVSGGDDRVLRLWNVEAHDVKRRLVKHTDAISALALVDGRLVSASLDHSLTVWNLDAGAPLTETDTGSPVIAMTPAPGGKQILTLQGAPALLLWEANAVESASLAVFGPLKAYPWSAVFSSDSASLIVAAGGTGGATELLRYALDSREEQFHLDLPGNTRSLDASPAGDLLALDTANDHLELAEAATGRRLVSLETDGGRINHIRFSPDGKLLFTSALDNQVRVYDVQEHKLLSTLRGHSDWALSLAASPDGKEIVSTSRDGTAIVWDVAGRAQRTALALQPTSLESVAWSPDGKTIATGGNFGAVKLWDAKSGALVRTLVGNRGLVYDVNFSPDGKYLVTAGEDRLSRIWDLASGEQVRILGGHSGPVTCARFSPDGTKLLTASTDGTVRVWAAAPP
jgi:WD40 repeat protein